MTLKEIKQTLHNPEYRFLTENSHLGSNVILLTLGGSHAYGTNIATSDLDVRGCALNNKNEILLGKDFENVTEANTDTVIYSFNKLLQLLASANPNTIEMLGCKPEHYLYLTNIGQELLDNRKIFLSKQVIHSFGGYALAQMRRLDNKAAREVGQAEKEQHILNSIKSAAYVFPERYFSYPEDAINLYVDKAVQEDYDTEIFMDINLKHYPLRDYRNMWNELNNIVKEYGKIGKRNSHAIQHDKLGKHMMHLVRLYLMATDILAREEIITYREKDHDFLMSIRNGAFLDSNNQPTDDFFSMVNEYEKELKYAAENTSLPDKPDMDAINELRMSVNEKIVKGDFCVKETALGDDTPDLEVSLSEEFRKEYTENKTKER